ncbi:MAG: hypothetical protein ACYTG7_14400 [Planctomycetota bacterium]|jgi:hypothetical protein
MMNENEKEALRRWYSQDWIIAAVNKAKEQEDWDALEANVQKHALLPLSKHGQLPDFMRTEEGKPLFPTSLSPLYDAEGWQDAIEIGWAVIEEKTGISMEHVQDKLRAEKDADWDVFMKSVEKRKKERGEDKEH